ncbi:golgin subfamily A member 6-like protein 10 isoform X2 [Lates calcarifer]|uniref:Golgin subfamily A member 6-like protein 10 isoform X2 n=1 Tax=Lates calcarifer TaxID=8187 RepID=A0AAJ8B2G1_LATCA|nr:golgin subfamily A member 6-like protein 10 isoform X2 [Lates calcarifer]
MSGMEQNTSTGPNPGENQQQTGEPESGTNIQDTESNQNDAEPQQASSTGPNPGENQQQTGEPESGTNIQDTESNQNDAEPQQASSTGPNPGENQQQTGEPESGTNIQDTESNQNDAEPQQARMATELAVSVTGDTKNIPVSKTPAEIKTFYEEKLHEARSALKQKDEELKSVKDRLRNEETMKPSCRRCEQHEREHKESMTEMETFYKEKLQEARSALKQKEEELKSFKDRVAPDLALSIKTGDTDTDTESMNNPVSKTKLTEMYNKLKLLQWPKIKDHLKSNAVSREFTRDLSQKMFRDAAEEMERKKKQIDEVFGLTENSSGLTPQKVKEFRQLTIHSLQMNLYHRRKEDLLQSPFLDDEAQYSQDVMVNFRLLASECYWLGSLMALNNPPLQPDWENISPGMDTWDIFPRDIKSV